MRDLVTPLNFRNIIFGIEDSLVSTVGLLSGIAIAGVDRPTIFITGVVLILVEAISMAAGSFLSEASAQEYEVGGEVPVRTSFVAGFVMFVSYFVAGFIPLLPYVIVPGFMALPASVALSLLALFTIGGISAAVSGTPIFKRSLRMLAVGGLAIVVGMLAGGLLVLEPVV